MQCMSTAASITQIFSFPLSFPLHIQFDRVYTDWQNIVPPVFVCCGITEVSEERWVPDTIYTLRFLKCWYVLDTRCGTSKSFHQDCVSPSERHCYTTHIWYFGEAEEAIASLCDDMDIWWCYFCIRPLFKTRDCLFYGATHM